jgi:hypothetical protein
MEPKIKILLICLTRRGGLLHFHDCLAESLSKLWYCRNDYRRKRGTYWRGS